MKKEIPIIYCRKLNGLTPDEAWRGIQINDNHRTSVLKDARVKRLEYNRANKCVD